MEQTYKLIHKILAVHVFVPVIELNVDDLLPSVADNKLAVLS